MGYLIFQIWVYLLIAAGIGAVAGWLLLGGSRRQLSNMNQEWSQRLANLEAERNEYSQKAEELNEASVRQGEMYLKLSEERDILSQRLLEWERGNESGAQESAAQQQRLTQCQAELTQMQEQLAETVAQLGETQTALQLARSNNVEGEVSFVEESESQLVLDEKLAELKEAEVALAERDEKIEQLHQKLASSLSALSDAKTSLATELEAERQKGHQASQALQEAQRQVEEFEEQLKCSENTLGNVSDELKQKQALFEVTRQELDSKLQKSDAEQQSLQQKLKDQTLELQQLSAQLDAREQVLVTSAQKESSLQQSLTLAEQQLGETQKALTESHQQQQQLESELHASQLHISTLESLAEEPQAPKDYASVSSGILSGETPKVLAMSSGGRASGWSKLGELARDGYEKVKEKVEDTTSEVVTATAKASPNDENYRVEIIRSIGNDNRRHLHDMGVTTTLNLLERCADEAGIKLISKALGREPWVVSSWVSIADLLRVKGIDGPMAEVLELSGVYSVPALAEANPEKLIQLIHSVNDRIEKLGSVPDIATVAGWIRHAETLKRYVE